MPYGLGMAARKRPTLEDAATACQILLDGLADGAEIFTLLGDLELVHPRNDTFPGEVFLRLAADALDGGAEPDLLVEVAWWQTDDFWEYALFAAAAYIRAAASRVGVPVRQACDELARSPVDPAP